MSAKESMPQVPEGILDILGMDNDKMAAMAKGVMLSMLPQLEPVIVNWVNTHLPQLVQSFLDSMEPVLFQWLTDNAGPSVQSMLDDVRSNLPAG